MIDFVFLDLDDTLLDFRAGEACAIRRALSELRGAAVDEAVIRRYSEINDAQWKRLERGELTIPEVRLVRFEILFAELGWSCSPDDAQATYERYLCDGHDTVRGAEALLDALYGKYALYIASNGTSYMQKKRIADAGLSHYFKDVFISEEMGAPKPKRAFFDACFARIPHFDPARAIILGDSLTSDIAGGKGAGIRTCLYNPYRKPGRADIVPDFEIDRLDAFCDVLDAPAD